MQPAGCNTRATILLASYNFTRAEARPNVAALAARNRHQWDGVSSCRRKIPIANFAPWSSAQLHGFFAAPCLKTTGVTAFAMSPPSMTIPPLAAPSICRKTAAGVGQSRGAQQDVLRLDEAQNRFRLPVALRAESVHRGVTEHGRRRRRDANPARPCRSGRCAASARAHCARTGAGAGGTPIEIILARDFGHVAHRGLLRRAAAGKRDMHVVETDVLQIIFVEAVERDAGKYFAGICRADEFRVRQRAAAWPRSRGCC